MKRLVLGICLIATFTAFAQKNITRTIETEITRQQVEPPLAFLSADEMRGRDTGSPELDIAANYIASTFAQIGLQQVPGADRYFQVVPMEKQFPPSSGEIIFGKDPVNYKDQFVLFAGGAVDFNGEFVYVSYGEAADITMDLKGKVAVAIAGTKDGNPQQLFTASQDKMKRVRDAGAVALIEYFPSLPFPWPAIVNFLASNPRVGLKEADNQFPRIWMKNSDVAGFKSLLEARKQTGSLKIATPPALQFNSKNVLGMVEGTDPVLKNQYIVISGHYDHVGVGPAKNQDSIYNGARDNAIGTVAMLTAARYFAAHPAKRSLVFMALTGEEKGLLGSKWYADNPLVPLKQTDFNFGCDGAGYNDKDIVTIIGFPRTSAQKHMVEGCKSFGLRASDDPVPEQNLYERSDNYNFARKGVPAIDFAPGIKAFDEELMKYYHQPADEAGSLDFDYLVRFYRAFVYSNYLIANDPTAPSWTAGDKYEATGKQLYAK